jgi:hypothetical protein
MYNCKLPLGMQSWCEIEKKTIATFLSFEYCGSHDVNIDFRFGLRGKIDFG